MGVTGYLVIRDSASTICHAGQKPVDGGIAPKENRQAFGLPELEDQTGQ
jgi:hypothetical protein